MRRVVCRFDDPSDFLKQFRWTRATTEHADFSFVGEFRLAEGEEISLTTLVSRTRDQCTLTAKIVDVTPMADTDRGVATVYRHRARVSAVDAVWLEAFQRKLSTLRRMEAAA